MMSSETLTYRVGGMTCEHCRAAVTEEVTKVAGVETVDVDLDTKLVRVAGDGVSHDAVVAAIDEAGYDAERAS
jgi:copper chaperone